MSMYHTKEWHKLRVKALIRDGYKCVVCKKDVRGKKQSRVDHIKNVKDFPHLAWEITNLQTLCSTCDNRKHFEKLGHEEKIEVGLDGFPLSSEWSEEK